MQAVSSAGQAVCAEGHETDDVDADVDRDDADHAGDEADGEIAVRDERARPT